MTTVTEPNPVQGSIPLKAIVIEHLPFENIGAFGESLEAAGIGLKALCAATQPLDTARNADLVMVMGGPISANDQRRFPFLTAELALLEHRIEHGKPTLGVCLGAQLIAKVLGARVYPMQQKEIGWSSLELTAAGANTPLAQLTAPVLHWHGEMFDIPDGTDNLANTPLCPHQAFAVANHTLALQFHVEVRPPALEQWLLGHISELDQTGIDVPALRKDTAQWAAQSVSNGQRMIRQWLDKLGGGTG